MLRIADKTFESHLFTGTGKFAAPEVMVEAIRASGSQLVTLAMKRVDLRQRNDAILAPLLAAGVSLLPNTSGAKTAEEAVFAARLAREALGTHWLKLEIHPDARWLLPDPIETLKAAELLVREGFVVLPYCGADPVLCKRLEEVGCAAVMPLGAPIGSNQGLETKAMLEIIPTQTVMDGKLIKEKDLDISSLSGPVELVNVTPSFYEQYKYHIWGIAAVLLSLLVGLFVSLYFYYHTKKLKDELEVSEASLREAKERAEEANRLKSAFLANMSHEIRTPLNAIVGFSDVLSAGDIPLEEQRGFFEIIKANSDLLLRLIDDILDLSRLEVDRVTFTQEKCDVVQVCTQALASVAQARRSANRFLFESPLESLELHTDIQRMQQVIINLLSNADKFTKNGTITLKVGLDEKRHVVLFSVSDTGCGIPLEKQKKVFERFEKLNEYAQGTGLGLAICKLIVKKWGGKIWVDPHYTQGARFLFTHPLD